MNPLRPKSAFLGFLRQRPVALLAVAVIAITVAVAIFAYPLSPDPSPHANRMILELGARPPGFRQMSFLVPARRERAQPSLRGKALLDGWHSPYDQVPIEGWIANDEGIALLHYVDEGMTDTLFYSYEALQIPDAKVQDKTALASYINQERVREIYYPLGSDQFGRDILSRLLVGTRISLSVGVIAVLLSLSIGIILGSLAGYFGGWVDEIVMWFINVLWSIPTLLLVFAITLTLGKGFWQIFIAIGLTMWVGAARLIRGQVKSLKEMDYVLAARSLGASPFRIIRRHLWPNMAGPIMVIAAANFAAAILIEAGLSFLGIGVQPPQPSWGLMIKEHYNFLLTNKPFMALVPGAAIMLLVLSFHILGNAFRDYFDVRDTPRQS